MIKYDSPELKNFKHMDVVKKFAKSYEKLLEEHDTAKRQLGECLTKKLNDGYIYEFWGSEYGWIVGRYKEEEFENREVVMFDTQIMEEEENEKGKE